VTSLLPARATPDTTSDSAPDAPAPAPAGHDLPVLEVYRAGAALLVVLTHVGFVSGAGLRGPWAGWLARGEAGVAVFFVLSGFLLMRPWVGAAVGRRPPVRVRAYLWRRALRLLPAYLVAVAGVALLVPSAAGAAPADWLAAVTVTSSYREAPLLPGFTHTWSLGTEVAFYLVLPLLARAWLGRRPAGTARRAAVRALLVAGVLVVAALAWRTWFLAAEDGPAGALAWLPGHLDWFAAGMALAWLRERGAAGGPAVARAAAAAPGAWFAVAVSCYWVSTTPLCGPLGLARSTVGAGLLKHVLYLGFAVALLVPAVFGNPAGRWQRIAGSPLLVRLGAVSYGLFLWQMVVLIALVEHLGIPPFSGHFGPLLLAVLTLGTAAATASWLLLERPLQRRWRGLVR
jgi:peptidoglycan/LPS O-acetylase OafA/YrhL